MIQSFADRNTEELFRTESNKRFSSIGRIALRKLIQMNHAGFHSIRINGQWRIVFRWTDAGPVEVAIVDYH